LSGPILEWFGLVIENIQHRKEVDPENGSADCGVVVLSGLHKNPQDGYDKSEDLLRSLRCFVVSSKGSCYGYGEVEFVAGLGIETD
jgi:hypothetical protein